MKTMTLYPIRILRSTGASPHFFLLLLAFGLLLPGCSRESEKQAGTQIVTENTQNPLSDLSDARAKGKALYAIHCALCHGESGKGDGVAGTSLAAKPTDLSAAETAAMSDGKLFLVTKNGKLSNGKIVMPPSKNISDEQIWQIVAFLRTMSKY